MSRDSKENILLNSKAITIYSSAKVLVVGGGRAGYIKIRSFSKKGFCVDAVSPEFTPELEEFSRDNPKVKLFREEYKSGMAGNYELVAIGTGDEELNENIAKECREHKKLFIYLPDFKSGNISVPVELETENIVVSVGTKGGSPKTSLFLREKIRSLIEEYDDFVGYVCSVRDRIEDSILKSEVMEYMNTDDFYALYKAGLADTVLKTLYGGDLLENNSSD